MLETELKVELHLLVTNQTIVQKADSSPIVFPIACKF